MWEAILSGIRRFAMNGVALKYTSGIIGLDEIVEFKETELVVVASCRGGGMTSFMLNQAIENAKLGVKTLFASFEFNSINFLTRVLSNLTNNDIIAQFTDEFGGFKATECNKFIGDLENDEKYKLVFNNLIYTSCNIRNPAEAMEAIKQCIIENEVKVVFIDSLQLLAYDRLELFSSLNTVMRSLKDLANENEVLIIIGSVLSSTAHNSGLKISNSLEFLIKPIADIILVLDVSKDSEKNGKFIPLVINVEKDRKDDRTVPRKLNCFINCGIGKCIS